MYPYKNKNLRYVYNSTVTCDENVWYLTKIRSILKILQVLRLNSNLSYQGTFKPVGAGGSKEPSLRRTPSLRNFAMKLKPYMYELFISRHFKFDQNLKKKKKSLKLGSKKENMNKFTLLK